MLGSLGLGLRFVGFGMNQGASVFRVKVLGDIIGTLYRDSER